MQALTCREPWRASESAECPLKTRRTGQDISDFAAAMLKWEGSNGREKDKHGLWLKVVDSAKYTAHLTRRM